ncbi:unnamed protein product, partial [Polarella glacialis]
AALAHAEGAAGLVGLARLCAGLRAASDLSSTRWLAMPMPHLRAANPHLAAGRGMHNNDNNNNYNNNINNKNNKSNTNNKHDTGAEAESDRQPLLPCESVALPSQAPTAVAGVSSFGFGGTNAHAVLRAPSTPREQQ